MTPVFEVASPGVAMCVGLSVFVKMIRGTYVSAKKDQTPKGLFVDVMGSLATMCFVFFVGWLVHLM